MNCEFFVDTTDQSNLKVRRLKLANKPQRCELFIYTDQETGIEVKSKGDKNYRDVVDFQGVELVNTAGVFGSVPFTKETVSNLKEELKKWGYEFKYYQISGTRIGYARVKLPKQWLSWVKAAGLKPVPNGRLFTGKYYFTGFGRMWRITDGEEIQVSAVISEFDRWANSVVGTVGKIPGSKDEFISIVKELLEQAEKK